MENNLAKLTGLSDASMEQNTGKSWKEWITLLKNNNVEQLSHQEIVALLYQHIEREWWCQMITNAYERVNDQHSDHAKFGF